MPARNECPSGWTEEYQGYLMTAYDNHTKQYDFICVDEDAEARPGTRANKNGALLYPVEGVCGSLPCHPYVAAPSLNSVHQRLQALEKKLETLLKPRSGDPWFFAYLLGLHSNKKGIGLRGPPGYPGKPGTPGVRGKRGKQGVPGKIGPKGDVGKPGSSISIRGPRGPKGEPGAVGRTGFRGLRGQKGELGKSGVKYTRWGRTTCPSGVQIVYKGITGGDHYQHPGGGVNYLCLPKTPRYGRYKSGWQHSGYVYGTEYEVSDFNPFYRNLHNHDAPCVVCFAKSRSTMLMMPARNDCPSGWVEEYDGYLMTEFYNHPKQRDYICVDKWAEYIPGTRANRDGALLYPVQGKCGSLPCSPYVSGRELTCAVCTK
ncbi:short-chain collagen C4-like [Stylophora pistillata]|uniref:short-chain collagen C4-like n=1 Tax=Stylophora pistillata TaxID=50429 RepID=UPI000C03A0D4|nr:short-chain collagen C4-like [Stylophora pistillata]